MNVVAIIQARMGSSRLPGKVIKTVLGQTLLEYQIERVRRATTITNIVIATTTQAQDQPIVDLCVRLGIDYYRGSEHDVLQRYYEAATQYRAQVVVRLTSDCPVIDPAVIDQVVRTYVNHPHLYDYVSNGLERTFPRGMDTEVFSYAALQQAHEQATEPAFREHVTAYLYHHPEQFRLRNVAYKTDESKHRWTVDTTEDFQLIQTIIERLYVTNPHFTMEDVLTLLANHHELFMINHHIEQKKVNVIEKGDTGHGTN